MPTSLAPRAPANLPLGVTDQRGMPRLRSLAYGLALGSVLLPGCWPKDNLSTYEGTPAGSGGAAGVGGAGNAGTAGAAGAADAGGSAGAAGNAGAAGAAGANPGELPDASAPRDGGSDGGADAASPDSGVGDAAL